MSYSDTLNPRPDVLSEEGIEGIIDLTNLDDRRKRKLEARPADFLSLTYPTADAKRVMETLNRRFSGDKDAPGLYLFEGLKGSGKSHLLLLVYHLFMSQDAAQNWVHRHGLSWNPPRDAVVVVNKFTDLPLYSIWDFIFQKLTGKKPERSALQPGLAALQDALGDRSLILILDELEQGIRVIAEESARAQNIAFLQMLSEWGNRENRVTLFASIYSDHMEPGSTLKRVPACRVRFEHAADKSRVVLHRLFENFLDVDTAASRPTVDSYMAAWRRHGAIRTDDFEARFQESFPFSPDVLQILLDRVPARGGFQNVRGALGFLARLVKLTHQNADIITPANADLTDQEVAVRLGDLDPSGDLIRRACENIRDLRSQPIVSGLGSTAMLYTLSGSGRDIGAGREELIRATCTPATDINDFEQALLALKRYGSYFHEREGRYLFDREENADAKVEFRSLTIDPQGLRAAEQIKRLWCEELFRDAQAVVIVSDIDQTHLQLDSMEKGRLRFVLSPRRLSCEQRHLLYHGLTERNQVILLEPKDSAFSGLADRDILKWSQRFLAAKELATSTQDSARQKDYERIQREDQRNILEALKRAGMIYVRIENYGSRHEEDTYEEESLGSAATREQVVEKLSQEIYPIQRLAEHMEQHLPEHFGRNIKEVDRDYRNILGYPVPTHAGSVTKAIRRLCQDRKLAVCHPRGNVCGRDPELTETEIMSATLAAPFEKSTPPGPPEPKPSSPSPGQPSYAPYVPPVGMHVPEPPDATEEIVIASQTGLGTLRQELAKRLQTAGDVRILKIRLTIFLDRSEGDLATLPAGLRGSLAGPGSITAEIAIARDNPGGKAEVERLAESLPNYPGATYSARLVIAGPVVNEGKDSHA